MMQVFCGWDEREAVGFHVFAHSLIRRASMPVALVPLNACGLAQGSNAFTLSRFLIPYLLGFKGHAIFLDGSDMLCLADILEMEKLFDKSKAVQVVKHPSYTSQAARKYVGTNMEADQSNYERKNWASAMIINAEHSAWFGMTPKAIELSEKLDLLQFAWLRESEIGGLPPEWNVLVDEGQDSAEAKVLHWTNGIPGFAHYQNARRSKDWFNEHKALNNDG